MTTTRTSVPTPDPASHRCCTAIRRRTARSVHDWLTIAATTVWPNPTGITHPWRPSAPLTGANRTGRPFTGDFAGDLLYATLNEFGFAVGSYDKRADDSLALVDCRITNAVRCVPPQNKPTGEEARNCRPFLVAELSENPKLRAVLALGRIAHDSVLTALNLRKKDHVFGHGAVSRLSGTLRLYDSYHCSRYNTNTRRLTPEMFAAVFARLRRDLDAA